MFTRWFLEFEAQACSGPSGARAGPHIEPGEPDKMKRLSLENEIKRLEIEYDYVKGDKRVTVYNPSWLRKRECGQMDKVFYKWGAELVTSFNVRKSMLDFFNADVYLPDYAYPLYTTDEGKCDAVLRCYDKMFVRTLGTLDD
jgi:hypothetical protein